MASYKVFLTLTVIVAACSAQQPRIFKQDEHIPILRYDNQGVNYDGSYSFNYETANGIKAEETGYVKQLGGRTEEDAEAQVVQGSYSYTGPDGVLYTVTYIADENGFRAEGAHLPTPPPAIQRALEFINAQPKQPIQPSRG